MIIELAKFLGFLTGFVILFLILNFCLKWGMRHYVSKLVKTHKEFVGVYQKVMRIFIKYHKPVGGLAIILALLHMWLMITYFRISWFGFAALVFLIITGIIGILLSKFRGKFFLLCHRGAVVILIISLGLHALFK